MISADNLLTFDPDTSPDHLTYGVKSRPNNGELVLLGEQGKENVVQVNNGV